MTDLFNTSMLAARLTTGAMWVVVWIGIASAVHFTMWQRRNAITNTGSSAYTTLSERLRFISSVTMTLLAIVSGMLISVLYVVGPDLSTSTYIMVGALWMFAALCSFINELHSVY